MENELNDIIEKHKQLKAMQDSVHDFMMKLKDQQDKFLKDQFGFANDSKVTLFEVIKKVYDKKNKIILG